MSLTLLVGDPCEGFSGKMPLGGTMLVCAERFVGTERVLSSRHRIRRLAGGVGVACLLAGIPSAWPASPASAASCVSSPTCGGTAFTFPVPTVKGTYVVSGIVAPDYVQVGIVAPDHTTYSATASIVAPDQPVTVSIVAPDFTAVITFKVPTITGFSLTTR